MTLSQSPLSYEDCIQVLQAALDDPAGARIRFETQDAATYFRMRCHQARSLDRKGNAETYPKGHQFHNTSAFDRLTVREPRRIDGEWWLYIEQTAVLPGRVESISSGKQLELDLPAPTQRMLPPPEAPSDAALGDAFESVPAVPEPKGSFRR